MTGDFLDDLRRDWRDQPAEFEAALSRLRRARFAPHVALGFEAAITLGAVLTGLWFAWEALRTGALLFVLSAAVLLATTPVLMAATVMARRESLRWRDETPAELLRTGMRRAEAALRVNRIGRWHVAIIAGFIGLLWALELTGVLSLRWFVTIYTAICAPLCGVAWLWLARRDRRARRNLAACRRLLGEYESTQVK